MEYRFAIKREMISYGKTSLVSDEDLDNIKYAFLGIIEHLRHQTASDLVGTLESIQDFEFPIDYDGDPDFYNLQSMTQKKGIHNIYLLNAYVKDFDKFAQKNKSIYLAINKFRYYVGNEKSIMITREIFRQLGYIYGLDECDDECVMNINKLEICTLCEKCQNLLKEKLKSNKTHDLKNFVSKCFSKIFKK